MKTRLSTAIRLAAFSLLLGAPPSVQAQFNYMTNDGTITITQYTGSGGDVNIPAQSTACPSPASVTGRSECGSLTSVTIRNSVTRETKSSN